MGEVIQLNPDQQSRFFEVEKNKNNLPKVKGAHSQLDSQFSQVFDFFDQLPLYDPYGSEKRYHREIDANSKIRTYNLTLSVQGDEPGSARVDVPTTVKITPALIEIPVVKEIIVDGKKKKVRLKDEDGNLVKEEVYVYPGLKEDKVEKALRAMLADGHGDFSGKTTLRFTLQGLRRELEKSGTKYNIADISEALEVLHTAKLKVSFEGYGKEFQLNHHYLAEYKTVKDLDPAKYVTNGTICYVEFNSLVTTNIEKLKFKLLNNTRHGKLSNLFARHISTKLSLQFTNASPGGFRFPIPMIETIKGFGKELSSRMDNDRRYIESAIKELIKVGMVPEDILSGNKINPDFIEKVPAKYGRKRTVDIIYHLPATAEFASDMLLSNMLHKMYLRQLDEEEVLLETLLNDIDLLLKSSVPPDLKLTKLGIQSQRARDLVHQFGAKWVDDKIQEFKRIVEVNKGQKNYKIGYLVKMIENKPVQFDLIGASNEPEEAVFPDVSNYPAIVQDYLIEFWDNFSEGEKGNWCKWGLRLPHNQDTIRQYARSKNRESELKFLAAM